MKEILTYEINDSNEFISRMNEIVYLYDEKTFFNEIPYTKLDYFGYFQFGRFIINRTYRLFFQKIIVLKIMGEIQENTLKLKIKHPNSFGLIFNFIVLLFFGLLVLWNFNLYLGVSIILINLIQTSILIYTYLKLRKEFLNTIERFTK